ncbi:MAG: L-rhamnose/proton symporter RhaT [Candidatus Acidiferrales bacterium]
MSESTLIGTLIVLAAGFFQGTFLVPMKYTPKWDWENTWLGFSCAAYLLFPWILAALTVPDLRNAVFQTDPAAIGRTILFGLGWGLGALLMGLGVDYVGLAVGFAIILGLAASIGTLIPLLVLTPEKLHGPGGVLILLGMAIMLLGIATCSWAGKLKENKSREREKDKLAASKKSYGVGLALCILSGVLSSCGSLGFAFGSTLTSSALRHGAGERSAPNLLWAIITLPVFVCNASYCAYLLVRRKSFRKFLQSGSGSHYWLAALMGALWLVGMVFYGIGANQLGRLGPSIGWSILMSSVVIVANVWGLFTGEWEESGRKPVRIMMGGLAFLLAAIFIIGYSNSF